MSLFLEKFKKLVNSKNFCMQSEEPDVNQENIHQTLQKKLKELEEMWFDLETLRLGFNQERHRTTKEHRRAIAGDFFNSDDALGLSIAHKEISFIKNLAYKYLDYRGESFMANVKLRASMVMLIEVLVSLLDSNPEDKHFKYFNGEHEDYGGKEWSRWNGVFLLEKEKKGVKK